MAQRLPVVASFRDVAREIVYPPYSIYRGFARRRTQREYGLRSIASAADGNLAILNIIGARRPAAVGKIGSLELQAINAYVSGEGRYRRYRSISRKLHQFAGIFPPTGTGIDEFCRIEGRACDFLGRDNQNAAERPGGPDLLDRRIEREGEALIDAVGCT